MPYYKFGPNDIFYNQIKTYPEVNFIVYDNKTFFKDTENVAHQEAFTSNSKRKFLRGILAYTN